MQGSIRLKAKNLLHKSTVRLFVISLVSAVYRYGAFAGNIIGFFVLIGSDIVRNMTEKHSTEFVVISVAAWECVSFSLMLMSVAAMRMGEQFIYFTRSEGGKGRFLLLFKFFRFKKSAKALALYIRMNLLKAIWLFYFLLPGLICAFCAYYLYNTAYISAQVYFTLSTGTALLLAISLVVWRIAVRRYSAAPYYMALNEKLSVTEAIEKSVLFTDGSLTEGVITEYSFAGWILSCVFVIPIVYVVPYIKLCNATYITSTTPKAVHKSSPYTISLFPLSRQHIN